LAAAEIESDTHAEASCISIRSAVVAACANQLSEFDMQLSKEERAFLTTMVGIVQKLLNAPRANAANGNTRRARRSSDDARKLRKEVAAARKRNVPVKQIAEELGVTTSYIYQIGR
jgi:hypothetical protein